MALLKPCTVVLDSSQWANWLDDALRPNRSRRKEALTFHARLIENGNVPLLSWHHLEELLAIGDANLARDRVEFIAALQMIAWIRLERSPAGLGSIIDVVAAEAIAVLEGHRDLCTVRDRAKILLLRTGPAMEALGQYLCTLDMVRDEILSRREKHMLMATVRPMEFFDEQRTIGELATGTIRSSDKIKKEITRLRKSLERDITMHGDKRITDPGRMAEQFYSGINDVVIPENISAREMVSDILYTQGIDAEEIHDDLKLVDLFNLAVFRKRLRIISQATSIDFDLLRNLPISCFPHRVIDQALRLYGQKRARRPGSDVNDGYLASLAAYSDETCVDKRTAEDFRQASRRSPELSMLVNKITKVKDYHHILQ